MTSFHIIHVGSVYIVKDDNGRYYSTHKTRAEAQARIYELMKEKKDGQD